MASVLRLGGPGFPQDVFRRLELEGRMIDVEVVRQAAAEVVEHVAGSSLFGQHDVGGDDVHPAGYRPGVEIVNIDDARGLADMSLDLRQLDTLRRRLQ